MNAAFWVVQGLLALVFLAAGLTKLARPRHALVGQMAWVEDFDARQVKVIGVLEVLAAAGLLLPPAIRAAAFLTPLAAIGVVLLMLGAAATHARRGETPMILGNLVLLGLAAAVAIARFGPYHF